MNRTSYANHALELTHSIAALIAWPKYFAWADLLQRTFAMDVLSCPECGGRLRFLATIVVLVERTDRLVPDPIWGELPKHEIIDDADLASALRGARGRRVLR